MFGREDRRSSQKDWKEKQKLPSAEEHRDSSSVNSMSTNGPVQAGTVLRSTTLRCADLQSEEEVSSTEHGMSEFR